MQHGSTSRRPRTAITSAAASQLKELWPSWSLAIDVRLGDKLARDNLLPTDPQGGRPDNFYDLQGLSVYLSRRF